MARRPLPSLGIGPSRPLPPTVDEARASLGGRARTLPGEVGQLVRVRDDVRGHVEGVVVFASERERDVWVGEGRLRRVDVSRCEPSRAPADAALVEVASDARRFAERREGERVRVRDRSGGAREGVLVEQCRYGALVLADDGAVVAASFRMIEVAPPDA